MSEKQYELFLASIPGVGGRTIHKLMEYYGLPSCVYKALLHKNKGVKDILGEKRFGHATCLQQSFDVEERYEELRNKGIHICSEREPEYPQRLKHLKNPPYILFYKGNMECLSGPTVAMIGARECSPYGAAMADSFGKALGAAGITVVSGLARGIDGLSQNAALEGRGKTVAVLGCGVDICYPRSNQELYEKILRDGGCILSSFLPGVKPEKHFFPERNRIVAGLSDVVLVIEARLKSGTFITVDMALEQGKNVYAVPGRLTDRLSDGCNYLLRQGAGIALSPEDLLKEMELMTAGPNSDPDKEIGFFAKKTGTDKGERLSLIEEFLDYTPCSLDELTEKIGDLMERGKVIQELMDLVIEGRAKAYEGGFFGRV